jgi:hypothetical protein
MIEILIGKIQTFLANFSLLCYSVSVLQPEQRIVVDESRMIRTQIIGSTVEQKMVTVAKSVSIKTKILIAFYCCIIFTKFVSSTFRD